jgi:hypothetical protein
MTDHSPYIKKDIERLLDTPTTDSRFYKSGIVCPFDNCHALAQATWTPVNTIFFYEQG